MAEIIPGIHWFQMPLPMEESTLGHVNTYLIRGDNGYLLVDSGWNTEESFRNLEKQLHEIGADIREISRILVTHIHPDHYGGAGRIKRFSGSEILLHEIEKGFIEPRYVTMDELLGQTDHWLGINGVPADTIAGLRDATIGLVQFIAPVFPDVTLHGGEIIATGTFTFKVIWTPGHSSGHICLYEPDKKILISGDHILPTITPNISRHPQSIGNPLGDYIDSLNDMKKLDVSLVLPGHEQPFSQFQSRVEEIIRHHEQRTGEIMKAVKGEPKTAYRIALEVIWGDGASWQDLPGFHKRMAIFETLAHLELMVAKGQIEKLSDDGIISYRQN